MPIEVQCGQCEKRYRVGESAAGKSLRCKACGASIAVPADTRDAFDYEDFQEDPRAARAAKVSKKSKAKRRDQESSRMMLWVSLAIGGGVLGLLICCGGVAWLGSSAWQSVAGGVDVPDGMTYQQWRDGFESNLVIRGPAPQDFDFDAAPPNVEIVKYPSDGLELTAWVYRPPNAPGPSPALVFFHGGFAFGAGDLETCRPFMDAGYVVMAPMLRGENGNPGDFELFLGEVSDGRAAVQWLAKDPRVDASRIYTFGHSVGGGVSAVLSLLEDVPIQHGGSSGGLYDHLTFMQWMDIVPFENTAEERTLRVLVGNIEHMQHPHYAYIGSGDIAFHEAVESAQAESGPNGLLKVEMVPGDHFTSFDESLRRYLRVIESGG